jgi:hypothetical protein
MRAEVSLQALNGELREFFFRTPGVNNVFDLRRLKEIATEKTPV